MRIFCQPTTRFVEYPKSPNSAKQVPVWRYNEKAVARLRALIPTQ